MNYTNSKTLVDVATDRGARNARLRFFPFYCSFLFCLRFFSFYFSFFFVSTKKTIKNEKIKHKNNKNNQDISKIQKNRERMKRPPTGGYPPRRLKTMICLKELLQEIVKQLSPKMKTKNKTLKVAFRPSGVLLVFLLFRACSLLLVSESPQQKQSRNWGLRVLNCRSHHRIVTGLGANVQQQ